MSRSLEGSSASVVISNRLAAPGLLSVYGYNYGYLEYLLLFPPDGALPPTRELECGDYLLDCQSPGLELITLEALEPSLAALQRPRSVAWARMDSLVETYGEGSLEEGQAVWEEILSDSAIAPAAYGPLIDLSIGFLLVSDASALAALTAWADKDPFYGRCADRLNAGLTLWAGAYFMGLASSALEGEQPVLECGP